VIDATFSCLLRFRCAPVDRAAAGWLRFGITALPEQGPPSALR
jgi:hypothetical protein